jgi:transcriptional regulator with XRE-family HTH domain
MPEENKGEELDLVVVTAAGVQVAEAKQGPAELPLVTRQLMEYAEGGGVEPHELAAAMGVHRSYVSAIFTGRRRVSAKLDTRIRQAVRTVAARRARNVGLVVKDPEGQK